MVSTIGTIIMMIASWRDGVYSCFCLCSLTTTPSLQDGWGVYDLPVVETLSTIRIFLCKIYLESSHRMTDGWIVGLMDDWVWVQRKYKMAILYSEIEKGILHFFTGLFYSYVSDTQPSSNSPLANKSIHPIIHGTAVILRLEYGLKIFSCFRVHREGEKRNIFIKILW